jgi:hypothetical protein
MSHIVPSVEHYLDTTVLADAVNNVGQARRAPKRKRVRKNDGRLKRPINSFLLFAKEYRPALLLEHGRLNNQQVSKLLGVKWKSMTDEEKAPYTKEAEIIHAKFMQDHPDFSWHGDKEARTNSSSSSSSTSSSASTSTSRKKRGRTSSMRESDRFAASDWEAIASGLSPNASEFDDLRRASDGDIYESLLQLDFQRDGGEMHLSHLPSDDSMYSPSSSTSSAVHTPIVTTCTTPALVDPHAREEVEVLQLGAIDHNYSLWTFQQPVPTGFKVVYVPVLVPYRQDNDPSRQLASDSPCSPAAPSYNAGSAAGDQRSAAATMETSAATYHNEDCLGMLDMGDLIEFDHELRCLEDDSGLNHHQQQLHLSAPLSPSSLFPHYAADHDHHHQKLTPAESLFPSEREGF